MKLKFKICWLFAAAFFLQSEAVLGASDPKFAPILELQPTLELPAELPGILWDPTVPDKKLNEKTAEKLRRKALRQASKIRRSGKPTAKSVGDVLTDYLSLAKYAYQKAPKDYLASDEYEQYMQQVISFAETYKTLTKEPREKARAEYHIQAAKFLLRVLILDGMNDLKAQIALLDPELKPRAYVLLNLCAFEKASDLTQRLQALSLVGQAGAGLPPAMIASLYLLQSAHLAGIDRGDGTAGKALADYKVPLRNLAPLAPSLTSTQRSMVMNAVVGIWQKDPTMNWANPPLDIRPFADVEQADAIVERAALDMLSKKDFDAPAKYYLDLVKKYPKKRDDLIERYVDLRQKESISSNQPVGLERALAFAIETYRGSKPKDEETTSPYARYLERHDVLRVKVEDRARKPEGTSADREMVIRMLLFRLPLTTNRKDSELIEMELGRMYDLAGNYPRAVTVFNRLAQMNDQNKEKREMFLRLTISSQEKLCSWPGNDPISILEDSKQLKSDQPCVERLQQLYRSLLKVEAKPSWATLANYGTLNILRRENDATLTLWQGQLGKLNVDQMGERVASYLIALQHQEKNWQELEKLAAFAEDQKMPLRFRGDEISPKAMLGEALLSQGKFYHEKKDYKTCTGKLDLYTNRFPNLPEYDEAAFVHGQCLKHLRKNKEAISVLSDLITRRPSSPFAKLAMKEAAELCIADSQSDAAGEYFNRYIVAYPQDDATPGIRLRLAALRQGSGDLEKASDLLRTILAEKRGGTRLLSEAGARLVEMVSRGDDRVEARAEIELFRQAVPDSTLALAYEAVYAARDSAKEGDMLSLDQHVSKLRSLSQADTKIQRLYFESLYLAAEIHSGPFLLSLQTQNLRDPTGSLRKNYAELRHLLSSYQAVCRAGKSPQCAKAHYRSNALSRRFVEVFSALEVRNLAKENRKTFVKSRKVLLGKVQKVRQKLERAITKELLRNGQDREFANQVIKDLNAGVAYLSIPQGQRVADSKGQKLKERRQAADQDEDDEDVSGQE